jgi:hypothetical protein
MEYWSVGMMVSSCPVLQYSNTPCPSTRPYAEFRFRDIEGNPLDLSQTKGWEVGVGKWETAA